jgi:hypothetical protein
MPIIPEATAGIELLAQVQSGRQAPSKGFEQDADGDARRRGGLGGRTAAEVLRKRCSVREFSDRALRLDVLQDVLHDAADAYANLWPTLGAETEPSLLIAADSVSGLAEGVHLAGLQGRRFTMLPGSQEFPGEARRLYTGAPALVFVCGDIADACRNQGVSYAEFLLRASSFGYAAWLSGIARGLSGSVFGRASAEVTNMADDATHGLRHLFTLALGHAPGQGPL